jgi:8-oxo-dGTP diphosphatase
MLSVFLARRQWMKRHGTMVYIEQENKFLFLVRNKVNDNTHLQGMYLPIGGKVEDNESIEECAIREAKEEAGITLHDVQLKAVLHFRGWGKDNSDWVNFLFTSDNFSGQPTAGNEGHFEWINKSDISKLKVYEGDKIFLSEILTNKFVVIEFDYSDFTLQSHKVITRF